MVDHSAHYPLTVDAGEVANKDTQPVVSALIDAGRKACSSELYKSLTWDRGKRTRGSIADLR